MSRRWDRLTSPEVRAALAQDPVVIVPVGSVEQHGDHLPLSTDSDIGIALAEGAAEAAAAQGVPAYTTPCIWTGFSPHHMDFPGSITLRTETFLHLLCDVVGSLYHHGVNRVLLLNSHGGNISLVKAAADELGVRHGKAPVVCTYWHLIGEGVAAIRRSPAGGMGHACELETSLQLLFDPGRVRQDRLKANVVPPGKYHSVDMFAKNPVGVFRSFKAWSENGVIGDPTMATAELGRQIYDMAVAVLADVCAEIYRGAL